MREHPKHLNGRNVDDDGLNGYPMYPKVFLDYRGRQSFYGSVRTMPTPVFFYGMWPSEEIQVEIDRGKTLEIPLQADGQTTNVGDPKVFLELNGQPRVVRVPNRALKARGPMRLKAQDGNVVIIAAPSLRLQCGGGERWP